MTETTVLRLRHLRLLFTWKTLIITGLSVGSTALCIEFNVVAKFPLALMATAVVFPIVFSIGGAYKRREAALDHYGDLKAHGRAIFFASRDWLPETSSEIQDGAKARLVGILDSCRALFTAPARETTVRERDVYRRFSELSQWIRSDLRERGLPSGECSRCNQFVSKMIISFERIKHIYQYRTPRSLRAFSDVFIALLPPLYGPYFAFLANDSSAGWLDYVTPTLFAIILTSLDSIQTHLENPFDQVGVDDVTINAEKFVANLDDGPMAQAA